ncbi:MAG: DNA recombination protein RmuC [Rikenellaceae bacterium]
MSTLLIVLMFFLGAIVSFVAVWLVYRSKIESYKARTDFMERSLASSNDMVELYKGTIENMEQRTAQQQKDFEHLQAVAKLEFEKVAGELLESKSKRFTEINEEKIGSLLSPLGRSITDFRQRVESTFTEQTKQRTSLEAQVRALIEMTQKIGNEANNLASALKGDSKKMGNWGEMILESILENSGLRRGEQFMVQSTIEDEETGAKLRPDIIVNLPDSRIVIIDSKVSLVGYDRYCSAESEGIQSASLKEHRESVRCHIDSLAEKNYDNLSQSLDFVMMFIPIEPAYLLAIQSDQELWSYAYKKRVLLISPTNLIACLKLISDLWKREQQSKNALEIVRRAELMYEKFVGFTASMEKLGDNLEKSRATYTSAMSQLTSGRGNLISQATTMHELGLKSSKKISEKLIETTDFAAEE